MMKKTLKTTPSVTYHNILHYAWPIMWAIVKVNPSGRLLFEFAPLVEYCWPLRLFYLTYLIARIKKYRRRH